MAEFSERRLRVSCYRSGIRTAQQGAPLKPPTRNYQQLLFLSRRWRMELWGLESSSVKGEESVE
jgi:hypothetical protein